LKDADALRAYLWQQCENARTLGARAHVKWIGTGLVDAALDTEKVRQALRRGEAGERWTPDDVRALGALELAVRLDHAREHGLPFQLCSASAYVGGLGYTAPLTPPTHLETLSAWIARYPEVTFDILNCDYAAEPFFTSVARTQRNVCLSGIWWHAMSEGWIADIMYRRLLAVPIHKLGAFFSDAYCAEWVYGKYVIVRHGLVAAFARAVQGGLFSLDDARAFMRQMLYDTPQRVYGL
jgi:glucuronate isomerase